LADISEKNKICIKCLKILPLSNFHNKRNDCEECQRIYNRESYLKNKESILLRRKQKVSEESRKNRSKRRIERDEELRREHNEWLRLNACIICGETDICVLESDHIEPQYKNNTISSLMSGSKEAYYEERKKIQILCVNCHRLRSHSQQNSWANEENITSLVLPSSVNEIGLSLRDSNISKINTPKQNIEFCWNCRTVESQTRSRYCSKECIRSAKEKENRYCGDCEQVLSQSQFSGKDPKCKECKKKYLRKHYEKNISYYNAKRKIYTDKHRLENRKLIIQYLNEHACIGIRYNGKPCGESRIEVLDFDHRDRLQKTTNIANTISSWSWDKIKLEIEKCDVLCANCHRRKTHKEIFDWASKSSCPEHIENTSTKKMGRRKYSKIY